MGGSESRFIARPFGVDSYLMVDGPHDWHQKVVLGPKDETDRYQKIVLKTHGNAMNIRFDNHPQPYVRATHSAGEGWQITMEDWPGDKDISADQYRWKVFIFAKKHSKGGTWRQEDNYALDWDNMKGCSLKVLFVNMQHREALSGDSQGAPLGFQKLYGKGSTLDGVVNKVFWELQCVDHNLTAPEVAAATLVPSLVVIIVSAVVLVAVLAPEALPKILEGLSKPAMELFKSAVENAPKLSSEEQKKAEESFKERLRNAPTMCFRIQELVKAYTDPAKLEILSEIELRIVSYMLELM